MAGGPLLVGARERDAGLFRLRDTKGRRRPGPDGRAWSTLQGGGALEPAGGGERYPRTQFRSDKTPILKPYPRRGSSSAGPRFAGVWVPGTRTGWHVGRKTGSWAPLPRRVLRSASRRVCSSMRVLPGFPDVRFRWAEAASGSPNVFVTAHRCAGNWGPAFVARRADKTGAHPRGVSSGVGTAADSNSASFPREHRRHDPRRAQRPRNRRRGRSRDGEADVGFPGHHGIRRGSPNFLGGSRTTGEGGRRESSTRFGGPMLGGTNIDAARPPQGRTSLSCGAAEPGRGAGSALFFGHRQCVELQTRGAHINSG